MDEKLENAIQEFFSNRINDLNMDAPTEVTEQIHLVGSYISQLSQMLKPEDNRLLAGLEDSICKSVRKPDIFISLGSMMHLKSYLTDKHKLN